MGFVVVYDACVLYPAPLRDLLMRRLPDTSRRFRRLSYPTLVTVTCWPRPFALEPS